MWIVRNRLPSIAAALALASVAACGGGGGGGGSGASGDSASTPRLVLSKSAVDISLPVTYGSGPEETIGITLENPQPGSSYYIRVRATINGLRRLSDRLDGFELGLVLQFKAPFDLRPGVYDDTVIFEVCTDSACSSIPPSLTVTLPVRYTITAVDLAATLGASSVDLHALLLDPSFPGMSEPDLVLDGAAFMPFIEVSSTHNALLHTTVYGFDNRNYKLRYNLKAPATLGPGVFDDTITITVCLDPNCVNPFPESPLTLPMRLTVTDRVDGPNGYTVRLTDVFGAAMAWDPTRQRIYLSAPDRTGADRVNNVVAFDPVAGQISATVSVTSRPGALGISADAGFLYVAPAYVEGRLERLRLPDLVADLSTPLIDSRGESCHASDVAVAPSQPTVVALGCSLHVIGASATAVVIFDGTTLRGNVDGAVPDSWINADPHYVAWGTDASRVFAANDRTPMLYDISVDAGGVHVTDSAQASAGGRIRFAAGLLYADNGAIFDPDTLTRVATLVPQREGTDGVPLRVVIVEDQNRIFAIARFPDLPSTHFREPLSLVSFDLAQRTQIASMPLDPTLAYNDLLRFGNDGLAFLGEGRVILVNGPFVEPNP